MTGIPTLRDAWALAGAKPAARGLRALSFAGGGEQVLATVNSDGNVGILVRGRPEDHLQQTVAAVRAESGALGAELYPFFAAGRSAQGIHIWCASAELTEAFASFSDSLTSRLEAGQLIHQAFLACLEEFRRLVAGNGGLTDASLIGLLGELMILRELVGLKPEAIQTWAFPERDRHDFRSGNTALEVKTSLRSQSAKTVVSISAIDQLMPPSGGPLFLYWMRLERDPDGEISVNLLVEGICERLSGDDVTAFRRRVLGDTAAPAHDRRFTLQERQSFRVASAFPRLTVDRLSDGRLDLGISRVMYELDLSSAQAFRCAAQEGYHALLGLETVG